MRLTIFKNTILNNEINNHKNEFHESQKYNMASSKMRHGNLKNENWKVIFHEANLFIGPKAHRAEGPASRRGKLINSPQVND